MIFIILTRMPTIRLFNQDNIKQMMFCIQKAIICLR